MRLKAIFVAAVCLFLSCAKSDEFPKGKWVDLSHDFSNETLYWVTAEPFKRSTVAEGRTEKGYYYSAYNFSGAEHGGTHIDAPIHFAEGRKTVDQIGLEQLIAPAVKIDAAKWLVENRKIHAVGLDAASIDYGQSTDFGSHVALMTANIPAFENVANLDQIPNKGFHIIALPMKIKGGSGGPLRVIAFMPDVQ